MAHWRKAVPVLVSAALLAWVVWRVSPADLATAIGQVSWSLLLPWTATLVITLYFWDAVCLRWLFAQPDAVLPLRPVLCARGLSYLAGALNYEIGQGVLAWRLARVCNISVLAALGRCLLLGLHDLAVLLGLGLLGALASADELAPHLRLVCGVGLGGLFGLALLTTLVPSKWRDRLSRNRWGAGLGWWTWGRTVRLCLLRGGYYLVILVYTLVALPLCGVYLDYRVVFSIIPLVMVADGLPMSMSGLGTRETALLLLLPSEQPGAVVAFSLIWSSGLLIGRASIGLLHLWLGSALFSRGARPARSEDRG